MDPLTLAALAFFGKSLFGGGNSASNTGSDVSTLIRSIPGLADIVSLQANQAKRQDPLHAALTQLAMNYLPRSAFGSMGRPAINTSGGYGSGTPGAQPPWSTPPPPSPGAGGSDSSPGPGGGTGEGNEGGYNKDLYGSPYGPVNPYRIGRK